ncbi:MAG TPA: hypothetical protein VJZ01_10460 [Lachnospiraceae bacterium]|nr:hypothetical protein [Lachnospiraceae bacterium]
MICSNCGGEYAETDLFCPFCKKENEIMAEKIKQAKYQQLVQEEREIKALPQKRMAKSRKMILIIASVMVVILVIAIVGSLISGKVQAKKEYEKQSEYMTVLEDYYQAGDLEAMSNYIDENDIFQSKYDKYYKLARSYDYYISLTECIADFTKMTEDEFFPTWEEAQKEELCISNIYFATNYGIKACKWCREGIEKYGEIDNVEQMQKINDQCIELLMNQFCYTEEEIEEMCALEDVTEKNLTPYCEQAYATWRETVE